MSKYVENLKAELEETSELHPTITVKRSDLESLVKAFEKTTSENIRLQQAVEGLGKAVEVYSEMSLEEALQDLIAITEED